MFYLLAEGPTFESLTPAISAIGSLGFAIWFAYYTTTVTLPQQQKEHRDEREKLALEYRNERERREQIHAETIKELVNEMRAGRADMDRWRMGAKA